MKKISKTLTMVLLFFLVNLTAQASAKNYLITGISVGNIRLGDSINKVKTTLGKPKKTKLYNTGSCSQVLPQNTKKDHVTVFDYQGLQIWLYRNKVAHILVHSPKYVTKKGIGVGAPLKKAQSIYGKDLMEDDMIEGDFVIESEGIYLAAWDGVVKHIRITRNLPCYE